MNRWCAMRSPASAERLAKGLGLGLLVSAFALVGCSSDQLRMNSSTIREVAHLKVTEQRGTVYVDRGPMTGTIDMTVTLTFDDDKRSGTFNAVASNGSLSGGIVMSSGHLIEEYGHRVFAFL